jgi:cytoskeletal protein RodZ
VSGEKQQSAGGLSPKTLLIAGAASAVTAVIVPMLWRPGTLFAAAATPIIVALVTEALKRPVDTVSAVTVRRTRRYTPVPERDAEETFDPLAPPTAEELRQVPTAAAPPPRRVVRRRRGLTSRQWRIGIVTGLVAFLGAAAVVTASELAIFGDSVSSGERRTSYFGGRGEKATPTPTPAAERQQEEDATPTPTPTETPEGEEEATPTPTATPEATETPVPTPTPVPAPETAPEPAPTAAPTPVPAP